MTVASLAGQGPSLDDGVHDDIGTRSWMVLLGLGPGEHDNHGERVVAGQPDLVALPITALLLTTH